MHLVQILLPLKDNDGHALAPQLYETVAKELTEKFGGLTAFTRAPAEGHWRDEGRDTAQDEVVVFEVMVERLNAVWWSQYRATLEDAFRQKQVIVRAQSILLL